MLRKTDEFSSVFSFRKRVFGHFLLIHFLHSDQAQVRVGFVVAKKVAKLAVDRNYMRRVLRELCRNDLIDLGSVDIVIQVQKKFKNNDFLLVKREFVVLIDKINRKLVAT
jgi:ribonuclease P protein component